MERGGRREGEKENGKKKNWRKICARQKDKLDFRNIIFIYLPRMN